MDTHQSFKFAPTPHLHRGDSEIIHLMVLNNDGLGNAEYVAHSPREVVVKVRRPCDLDGLRLKTG